MIDSTSNIWMLRVAVVVTGLVSVPANRSAVGADAVPVVTYATFDALK
jgi:hypothetical protein